MTAKELAEMMINGNLDYTPENDAHWIAEKYIQLCETIEDNFGDLMSEGRKEIRAVLDEDPAIL